MLSTTARSALGPWWAGGFSAFGGLRDCWRLPTATDHDCDDFTDCYITAEGVRLVLNGLDFSAVGGLCRAQIIGVSGWVEFLGHVGLLRGLLEDHAAARLRA